MKCPKTIRCSKLVLCSNCDFANLYVIKSQEKKVSKKNLEIKTLEKKSEFSQVLGKISLEVKSCRKYIQRKKNQEKNLVKMRV